MFFARSTPKPPKIRTKTVQVSVKKDAGAPAASSNGARRSASQSSRPRDVPTDRYNLTPNPRAGAGAAQAQTERRSASVGRAQKRKAVVPTAVQFASDTSSDEEDSDRLGVGMRKRQKTSSSMEPSAGTRRLDDDLQRRIRIRPGEAPAAAPGGGPGERAPARLVSALHLTRGEYARKYKSAFPGLEKNMVVGLHYPSNTPPEDFEAVVPHDEQNEYAPLADIYGCIKATLKHYIPHELLGDRASDKTGTVILLRRAVTKNEPQVFKDLLADHNNFVKTCARNGSIDAVLDALHHVPFSLTECILDQVYARIVSNDVQSLRRVRNRETSYGELLPQFVHKIFHQTGLNSSSVFVDLGSGIGNVVLQSALQTGAESWGIEILKTPAEFAQKQASELRARARRWNISLGQMHLLHGSFFESPEIDAVLKRATVVLVNNKVFNNETNAQLLLKFLDLQHGCKVVSLESFGGGKQGFRRENDMAANMFDEIKDESGTSSVSWAAESVDYFIATKVR